MDYEYVFERRSAATCCLTEFSSGLKEARFAAVGRQGTAEGRARLGLMVKSPHLEVVTCSLLCLGGFCYEIRV